MMNDGWDGAAGRDAAPDGAMTLDEYAGIVREALAQPPWRTQADKEADYADGNQLSSDLLRKQREMGIPPAKENVIGPAVAAVCGYEAKTRTDWRVTPDGDPQGQDVADAINYKLNQAERHSKADRALSQAFRSQVTVGIGWVEVTRPHDSRSFPIRCRAVHRNEMWWDMQAQELDLSDARWLMRRRWIERARAALLFPEHAEIISRSSGDWLGDYAGEMLDGGQSTGLYSAMQVERAWTVQEDRWHDPERRVVLITELWYRRWEEVTMLRMRNGRVVEFDLANALHNAAVQSGHGSLVRELTPKLRQSYWMGPHKLHDEPTPHPHEHFPYVPLFGFREDLTGVPFGLVRDLVFPQDNLNSCISKLRWGMSSVETYRTKGALAMTDEQFRRSAARVDADFVLDPEHFSHFGPAARFERKRDFQLNQQQFELMADSRRAIERVSGVSAAFLGQQGTATSGVQEQTQLEQSQVTLAALFDNFKEARRQVGEIIMALLIADMGREEQTVVIEGDTLNPPRQVVINRPESDPLTGLPYLSNDVQRTRLLVALEDVPSSSGFRAQQLAALSESVKALPPEMQQVTMPFMIDLMDLPRKREVVAAIRQATGQASPEQVREQVKQELMHDLKERELAVKERLTDAQIEKLMREAVQVGVTSAFAAMQAGEKIALNPAVAPIGDVVMKQAGWQPPDPAGQDPDYPVPTQAAHVEAAGGLPGDTSPTTPQQPVAPDGAADGAQQGIETLRAG